MAFWKSDKRASTPDRLQALVQGHLQDVDDETVKIVAAVAGLLATVAHADRTLTREERAHMERVLQRIQVLPDAAAAAVRELLDAEALQLGQEGMHRFLRDLRELADLEARREILDVLMDLAASDDELAMSETHMLRRIATGLGLDDADYLAAQQRHREKLSVLKSS